MSSDWVFRVAGQSIAELIENMGSTSIYVGDTAPDNPKAGMIWLDIS